MFNCIFSEDNYKIKGFIEVKMIKNGVIPKIIVICGPTGAGKTKFAIDIARQFNGEIVSADSMQVYRHMNIGTAKPSIDDQKLILHHMIDLVDPDQNFDASSYSVLSGASIKRIFSRGRNVFVVGGTGLYIKALVKGLFHYKKMVSSSLIRERLAKKAIKHGSNWLHQELTKIDKVSASKTHQNDVFRIIRALEVFEVTGKTITSLHSEHREKFLFYDALTIGLLWPRLELYQRINARVDSMISQGFIEEVKDLLTAGYLPNLKSMKSLGYRHISGFLNGVQSWDEALNLLKRDHRRYAKRQMTWFKADPSINWLNINQLEKAEKLINGFLV